MAPSAREIRLSKLLSFVLRHGPSEFGLTLTPDGWVAVDTLLTALANHGEPLARSELEQLVRTNDKQRFALSPDGSRIRANQGHSLKVDLAYSAEAPPELLYHGTVQRFLASIERDGIRRGQRHHVHLSETTELAARVGARRGEPLVLSVDARAMAEAGYEFFRTPNGVWLTEHVPARFVRETSPGSSRSPRG
ncbi:MAG: RNA 2'-phosphotransferase [Polyangiaceae bacterium]